MPQATGPRLEAQARAEPPRDAGQSCARIVERMSQKTEKRHPGFPDGAKRREDGFAQGRSAEQRESYCDERGAQTQSALSLRRIAHDAAHIRLGASRHDLGKVLRHLNHWFIHEREVQFVQQASLRTQISSALRAILKVLLKPRKRRSIQLTIKVSDDFFTPAN